MLHEEWPEIDFPDEWDEPEFYLSDDNWACGTLTNRGYNKAQKPPKEPKKMCAITQVTKNIFAHDAEKLAEDILALKEDDSILCGDYFVSIKFTKGNDVIYCNDDYWGSCHPLEIPIDDQVKQNLINLIKELQSATQNNFGAIAQWIEQRPSKSQVVGSTPASPANFLTFTQSEYNRHATNEVAKIK